MANATFNGIIIGDHAWVVPEISNEVEMHKIPRADGVILRRKGGGLKTLTVHGWKVVNDRVTLEQYLDELAGNFTSALGDLIINGRTYSNCIFKSVGSDSNHNRFTNFNIVFLKSGD